MFMICSYTSDFDICALMDKERLLSELTRSDSLALTPIGTPCVFTMLADRQGVPIALTQFCPSSNLL